jgi:hypothetical protein
MKTTILEAHGEVGDFIFWFNLLCQRVYSGGLLRLRSEAETEPEGTIGRYAYVNDGSWVEVPALSVDYRNGFLPFGSYVFSVEGHGFSASGCDFYLYGGISYPEAKQPKQEGTFRVKNDAKFLAEKVVQAWRKLGGTAELKKDHSALVCVGKEDVWVSLYA